MHILRKELAYLASEMILEVTKVGHSPVSRVWYMLSGDEFILINVYYLLLLFWSYLDGH